MVDAPGDSATQLMSTWMPQLANELAMDILEPAEIQAAYHLSDSDWYDLLHDPAFDSLLREARAAWSGAKNVEARIKLKAQLSIEMSLLRFHEDIGDKNIALSARTEALKAMMKLAGLDRPDPAASGGHGWSLTINLGNQSIGVKPAPMIEGSPA